MASSDRDWLISDTTYQNFTSGALPAPSSASKYGRFSKPNMPEMMVRGKVRMAVL